MVEGVQGTAWRIVPLESAPSAGRLDAPRANPGEVAEWLKALAC
jgi:hypothetical protein